MKKVTSLAVLVLACAACGLVSGAAAAETFHISPAGEIEGTTTLRTKETFEVACRVRLLGRLFETAEARSGATVGTASSVTVNECTNGTTVRTLAVFPLPIVIESWLFTERTLVGMLVRVSGIGILIEYPPTAARCLYNFTMGYLIRINRDGSTETTILLERRLVLVRALSFICPIEIATESASGTLSPRQTVTLV